MGKKYYVYQNNVFTKKQLTDKIEELTNKNTEIDKYYSEYPECINNNNYVKNMEIKKKNNDMLKIFNNCNLEEIGNRVLVYDLLGECLIITDYGIVQYVYNNGKFEKYFYTNSNLQGRSSEYKYCNVINKPFYVLLYQQEKRKTVNYDLSPNYVFNSIEEFEQKINL